MSTKQARRLAIYAQGFGQSQRIERPVSAHVLRQTMGKMHCIQLDAVPAVVRTQYMPAYSRLGPYQIGLLDKIVYEKDHWFEAWSHEASILPVKLHPLMRWSTRRAKRGETRQSAYRFANEQPAYVKRVLREIKARGRLRSAELTDSGERRETVAGWGTRNAGSLAMDYLFRCGELGIRRVGNFEKQFDLIERIIPSTILDQPTPSESKSLKELIVLSVQALGVAGTDEIVDYFRLPNSATRPLFSELVEAGRLEAVSVQGYERDTFKIPKTNPPRSVNAAALVSPFDPIVWNRKRDLRLFDFDYKLEIYTPATKRRWGYYVFPFLLGDSFAARVDLKHDRERGVLRVLGAYLELGCDAEQVANELAAEIDMMSRWVGAQRIVVGRRGGLIDPLRSAIKRL